MKQGTVLYDKRNICYLTQLFYKRMEKSSLFDGLCGLCIAEVSKLAGTRGTKFTVSSSDLFSQFTN